MKNKGFTLVELLAVIVILGVLIGVASISYIGYLKKGRDKSFKVGVNSLSDAALSLYSSCNNDTMTRKGICDEIILNTKGETSRAITLSELVDLGLIDEISDPYNTNNFCSGSSYVIVTLSNDLNYKYDTKTCLMCGDKRSEGCD